MAIWIQSLSWALIYSLAQGFLVYASLRLIFRLVPGISAGVKYHLSLSALTVLFVWFVATWSQQFHALAGQESLVSTAQYIGSIGQRSYTIQNYGSYHSVLSSASVIFPWLSAFYFIGLALMLLRLFTGMLQLFSLRKNGISQPDTTLN